MDDEFEEQCEELTTPGGAPVRPIDWLITATTFARNVADACTEALSTAELLLCDHANFEVNQRTFMEQAALEIESMTTEE